VSSTLGDRSPSSPSTEGHESTEQMFERLRAVARHEAQKAGAPARLTQRHVWRAVGRGATPSWGLLARPSNPRGVATCVSPGDTRPRERRSARARRTATSRDDGGDSDGPGVAGLTVYIVGAPSAESDAAIARSLRTFLERERPDTAWTVAEPGAEAV
jgi:hypothetical protein